MAKRRCTEKTKRGKRCRNAPYRDLKVCLAHAPKEVRDSRGFGGPQEGSGAPRKPKPSDVARELVERNVIAVLRPYFRTLGVDLKDDGTTVPCEGARKWVWTGVNEDALEVVDLGAQIFAAERLQDRIYGKPRQAVEISGDQDGDPVELEHRFTFDDETRGAIRGLLERQAPAREE